MNEGMNHYEKVRTLIVKQKQFLDGRDETALARIYARDAQLTIWARGSKQVELIGREAIVRHIVAGWQSAPADAHSVHIVTNVAVEDHDEGQVRGYSYQLYMRDVPGDYRITGYGTYDDVYALEDGEWRLRQRELHLHSDWYRPEAVTPR